MNDKLISCSKCNGEGWLPPGKDDDENVIKVICPKCHGHKKVDWVENVVGKKIPKTDIYEFFEVAQKMTSSLVGLPPGYVKCDGKEVAVDLKDMFNIIKGK